MTRERARHQRESVVLPASEAEQRDQSGGGNRQQHPQRGLGFIAGLGQREHRQHGGIGGHAVARSIRDHAAQGQSALRQRDLGELVAVVEEHILCHKRA